VLQQQLAISGRFSATTEDRQVTDITETSQDECYDIRTWPPDRQLDFYTSMFFDSRLALWSFHQLPFEQQQHIVSRCGLLLRQTGCNKDELGILPQPLK
jgi:hypothetical protein